MKHRNCESLCNSNTASSVSNSYFTSVRSFAELHDRPYSQVFFSFFSSLITEHNCTVVGGIFFRFMISLRSSGIDVRQDAFSSEKMMKEKRMFSNEVTCTIYVH